MVIGRDIITTMVIDIKFSSYTIVGGVGTYKGFAAPMVNLKYCEFESIIWGGGIKT